MKKHGRGFTLVEIMIALAVLAIAFLGLIASVLYTTRMNAVNRETTAAMKACEQVIETMEGGQTFGDIFRRYNTHATDQNPTYAFPYGASTPGSFEVLTSGQIIFGDVPAATPTMFARVAAGTRVGTIQFPERIAATNELDETRIVALFNLAGTGPQTNVDSDATYNETSVTTYTHLPVVVTIAWRDISGTPRQVQVRKILVAR